MASTQLDYVLLGLGFCLSRALLYAAGLRFNLVLDWMFLADPADLRERLLETAFYFHAFPPGWNLLTGALLKLSEAHVAELAHAVFLASGLLLAGSLMYLLRAAGLPRRVCLGVAFAFSLIPPTLYFENLYLYDYPVPALLTFAGVLFHRALLRGSFRLWLALFAVCTLLGWLRSALHLVWFVAILLFSLFATPRAEWRRIVGAAIGPALVLLALYLKNFVVFGVFDSQSQSGGNFTLVTTYHMPRDLRARWVAEGKLSPFSELGFAAPPSQFVPYLGDPDSERWPQLSALERPTLHAPNYNHWFFLEVNRQRRQDAWYCLRHRPWQYLKTVFGKSLPQAFSPSTLWHPRTGQVGSPHYAHHEVLGAYEDAFNFVLHRAFFNPLGWYAFLPLCLGSVFLRGRALLRSPERKAHAQGAILLFCLLQIGYLVAITALLTWGENARYRYIVEPLIWVVAAAALQGWAQARRKVLPLG